MRTLGDCWELFAFPLRFALLHTSDYQLTGKVHAVGVADLMLDLFTLVEVVLSVTTLSVPGLKTKRSEAQMTLLHNRLMEYLPCCETPPASPSPVSCPSLAADGRGFITSHQRSPAGAQRRRSSVREVCCAYAGERKPSERREPPRTAVDTEPRTWP